MTDLDRLLAAGDALRAAIILERIALAYFNEMRTDFASIRLGVANSRTDKAIRDWDNVAALAREVRESQK